MSSANANSPAGITATGGDNRSAAQWPPQSPGQRPYPQMPAVGDKKPLLESIGASGVAIFSGIITSEEYNPDFYWRDGIKVYEQMLRSDGQIRAIRQVVENPIKRATWSIEPGSSDARDKEIAAFVETCLFHDMVYTTDEGRTRRQAWATILHHILMHLWYGFMAFEVDWRVEDGWVKWAKWEPLLPRTVWRWWVGRDTELVGIQQWTFKDWNYAFTDIPSDKLLLFVHQQEGANYEGLSLLRTAYKHWWYKQNFEKIEAIGIERNAVVPPIITLPDNFTAADIAAAQKLGANMRASELGYATLPPGWLLDYPAHMTPFTSQVQPAIQYHDIMIARNVLAQFINLGSTETGAYALADAQQEMFLEALEAVTDYICDIINNDAIPRLVDYNFHDVSVYPRLRAARLANADISQVADAIGKLKARDANFLNPDPEMEDYLREQFGFPKAPKSVVQALNPTARNTPQRPDDVQAGQAQDHTSQQSASQKGQPQPVANQAQISAATNAISPAAPGDGGALGESLGEDVRLLREALASIAGLDAVERGMVFFNPNHDPRSGEFASGGAGGAGGGEGEGARGGRGSGGGKGGGEAKGDGAAKPRASRAGKAASAKAEKPAEESIHERSARLRQEQGLQAEVKPGGGAPKPVIDVREDSADMATMRARFPEKFVDPITGEYRGTYQIAGRLNAPALAYAYGERQLGAVLTSQGVGVLRDEAGHLGISDKGTKGELVSRITTHVTQGRYTADFGSKGRGKAIEETTGAKATRGGKARATKGQTTEEEIAGLHARSAELQRAGHLAPEVQPETKLTRASGRRSPAEVHAAKAAKLKAALDKAQAAYDAHMATAPKQASEQSAHAVEAARLLADVRRIERLLAEAQS